MRQCDSREQADEKSKETEIRFAVGQPDDEYAFQECQDSRKYFHPRDLVAEQEECEDENEVGARHFEDCSDF